MAANATETLAWACFMVGELMRIPDEKSRSQGLPALLLGVLFIVSAAAELAMGLGNPRQFLVSLVSAGPQLPLGVLTIAVGIRLRRLAPAHRDPPGRPGWAPLQPPWSTPPL